MLKNKHIIFIVDELNLGKLNLEHADLITATKEKMAEIENIIAAWKLSSGVEATHVCMSTSDFLKANLVFSNALCINLNASLNFNINKSSILSDVNFPIELDNFLYINQPLYVGLDDLTKVYSSYIEMCPNNDPIKYFKEYSDKALECKYVIYLNNKCETSREEEIVISNEKGVYKDLGIYLDVSIKTISEFTYFEKDAVTELESPIELDNGHNDIFCCTPNNGVMGFNSGASKMYRIDKIKLAVISVFNYRILDLIYNKLF